MSGYILRGGQENMTLPALAVESLLKRGEGDAALLYLALQRFGRGVTPEELEKVLPTMSRLRLDAAEGVLQELGLLPRPQQPRPEPAAERPAYSAEDITALLTDNEGLRLLIPQAEQQLGKKLRTADLQILAGLYDDLGLPADVIYLLLCHCVERAKAQWGEGRRPTMRQVEKEGYHWAQLGLFDQVSAAAYLRTWSRRRQKMGAYMQALHLPERPPVEPLHRGLDGHGLPAGDGGHGLRADGILQEGHELALPQRHPAPLARQRVAHPPAGAAGRGAQAVSYAAGWRRAGRR